MDFAAPNCVVRCSLRTHAATIGESEPANSRVKSIRAVGATVRSGRLDRLGASARLLQRESLPELDLDLMSAAAL